MVIPLKNKTNHNVIHIIQSCHFIPYFSPIQMHLIDPFEL